MKCLTISALNVAWSAIMLLYCRFIKSIYVASSWTICYSVGSLHCPGRRNIDTFDETAIQQHYCGPCNIECTNCKALHWKLEETTKSKYNKCYRGGDVLLDRVKPLPPFLASLIERTAQPNSLVKTSFRMN